MDLDFTAGKLGWRMHETRVWTEMLVRALKINRHQPQHVIDCTAGLGKDSFLLASLGCTVTAFERNAAVAALLQAALDKAATHPDTAQAAQRIQLHHCSVHAYSESHNSPEIWAVYCDPMFPEKEKSAAVKKEAAFLQETVGQDEDADQLMETALRFQPRRIVVKRPKTAPFLDGRTPHHQIKGRRLRYDIYYPENF